VNIKRVAITLRVVEAPTYVERRDAIAHDWHRWCKATFPETVLLPLLNDPDAVRQWLDAIRPHAVVLSNGNDWGEYPVRDQTELAVIQCALKAGIPLLGVCRGLQVLNVYFGGGLQKGLGCPPVGNHVASTHPIRLDRVWTESLGVPEEILVNSYHDQGVVPSGLASDLRIFASAPDDVVEGVYHPEKAVLGIQWHPERDNPSHDFNSRLIGRFFEQGAFWI
jgi:putative glutamine amidotransferase